ncbi:MAG: HlyU family transcriptional regulator, partial [Aestuariivirgaceae bacterium]
FFKRLFGGQSTGGSPGGPLAEPEVYNGYVIQPEPKQDGGQWHVAGVITREGVPDGPAHRFIRADTYSSKDDADAFSIRKARQIIDERGERVLED